MKVYNQREARQALWNLKKVTSFRYKKFFTVPETKVIWIEAGRRPGGRKREFGGLYLFINGKEVRGHIQFDSPFFFRTQKETQEWLNHWLSALLTRVINSMEAHASYDKDESRRVIEGLFGVKVI